VAVVTSRRWQRATAVSGVDYRGIALALALMVYTQIVFGAQVRHLLDRTAQRLHVLFAFALAVVVVWLFVRIRSQEKVSRGLHRFSWLLCGLLAVQVILGVEAWMHRFGAGVPAEMVAITPGRMVVRTAHFLVGALLFSASVAFALWAWRPVGSIAFANASTPEGAA
jgi:heme A synthase